MAERASRFGEQILGGARAVAFALDISVRTVRTMDACGRLPRPLQVGRLKKWDLDEVRNWVTAGMPMRNDWEAIREARQRRRRPP